MTTTRDITLDRIVANFEFLDDWEERFTYLIDLGKKLPDMPEAERVERNRVHGCQAQVFMKPRVEGEPPVVVFDAWSDAATVKGLITILMTMYSGKTADEILSTDAESVFEQLGLEEHLSMTRRNGLHAMIKRIRAIATELK
ncbi:MAG: SufE family protein [Phycisphaeraceae bacterium]